MSAGDRLPEIAPTNQYSDMIVTDETPAQGLKGAARVVRVDNAADITIGAVTVTAIVPGTGATNLGKAEDAAHTSGDVGVEVLTVRRDAAASGAGADGDYATLNTDANGRLWSRAQDDGPSWTPVQTTTNSADMSTAAAISAAPTAGQKVIADDVIIFSDTAMTFTLQEETTETVLAKVYLAANGSAQITLRNGLKVPTADKKLFGKASVAGNVSILVSQHSA
jgi:hypothetical protein